MKKFVFLCLTMLIALTSMLKAQEKITVGIMPFTTSSNTELDKTACATAQETVANAFVQNKRFTIVDRTKAEILKAEKELQKGEDFIDSKAIESGKALGAQYLILGNINSASVAENTTDGKRSYSGTVSIALKVVDITTGQVIASETITKSAGGGLFATLINSDTQQDAINKAIKGLEGGIDKFVKNNFPIIFSIAEISEVSKKGEAKTVTVAGGTLFGVKKGDKFKVMELTTIEVDGKKKERKKEIGELKVTKVDDENFSTCSVTTGGADINKKFTEKVKLQVITKE